MHEQESLRRENGLEQELMLLVSQREGVVPNCGDSIEQCDVCGKLFSSSTEHLTISAQKECLEHGMFAVRDAVNLSIVCLECAVDLKLNNVHWQPFDKICSEETITIRLLPQQS